MRIAVIGAGIAGLSAARRLASAGVAVEVFEKSRAAGGRSATRRHEHGGFDHGAQYFTSRSDAFSDQVADWRRRGVAARWDARIAKLARGAVAPTRQGVARYVGTPGMNALAKDLAAGLDVRFGTRIVGIEGGAGERTLLSEAGERTGPFDAVLFSLPAPQCVPLLGGAPGLAARAARVAMQPCIAGMVAFAEPVAADFDAAFVDRSPLAWVARNASKPSRAAGECWVLHASPEWSERNLERTPRDLEPELLDAFAEALGRAPAPTLHTAAHRWRFARSAEPAPLGEVWDAGAALGVCGDWTHGDRIEGAWQSGERLAREILGATEASDSG